MIINELGLEAEVVSAVMSKPISYLRKNKDTTERIKALKTKLKELTAFEPLKYAESVIQRL